MSADRTKQILALKARRGEQVHSGPIVAELDKLENLWGDLSSFQAVGFSIYVPMRLLTLIEVFVRGWARALVDHNERYQKVAEHLLKSVKFDHEVLIGLVGRKITLGDLVAHAMSTNEPNLLSAAEN